MSDLKNLPIDPMFRVIARCWQDAAFAKKLKSDPRAALSEYGVELPEGVVVKVLEDTTDVINLIIPMPPTEDELRIKPGGIGLASSTVSACRPCSCFRPSCE